MLRPDLHVELADGTRVGYAEVGNPDGPPVVHLHGTPGSRLEVCLPLPRRAAEDLGVRLIGLDRPGIGLSAYRRFSVSDYPQMVGDFADALRLGRFAVTGVSGGGKYACACAWGLPDRITRAATVSSTCSFDVPGARATANKQDRLVYALARWAPWLLRLMFAKFTHDARRDPAALFSGLPELGQADQEILAGEEFRQAFGRDLAEAFRQGGRGLALDYALEARPWGVPLGQIRVPVEIWHGDDDRLVSAQASLILADAIPDATTHFVPGAGHFLDASDHVKDILYSVVSGSAR
ncbi:MAG TPA: alpha/beta hydrolase [Streptosporangiaceae bacterium]